MSRAIGRLAEAFFGGKGKRKKSDGALVLAVVFVTILATITGYFTASAIMKMADRKYGAFENI